MQCAEFACCSRTALQMIGGSIGSQRLHQVVAQVFHTDTAARGLIRKVPYPAAMAPS